MLKKLIQFLKENPLVSVAILMGICIFFVFIQFLAQNNVGLLSFLKAQFINSGSEFANLPISEEGSIVTNIPYLDPFINRIYEIAKVIFEGVVIILIVYYGIRMMLSGGEEDKITSNAKGLFDAIIGLLLITLIDAIVSVFDPLGVGTDIVNVPTYEIIFGKATEFIQYSAGVVAFVMFFIAGYRLVVPWAKGSEEFGKSTNQILFAIAGLIVIMISEVVQQIIVGRRKSLLGEELGAIAGGQYSINESIVTDGIQFIESMIRVVLYFFMPIAVILVIYAGAQLVAKSYSDDAWGTAQSILKNVFISIIILLSAYTLVAELLKFAV